MDMVRKTFFKYGYVLEMDVIYQETVFNQKCQTINT